MAYSFCPMLVVVQGETKDSGFLPAGNYVEINGKKCPIGHCYTLEIPLGSSQVEIHSPPPNTIHRASTVARSGQLYRITLTVDSSRNIIDAAFGVDDGTDDPFGLYDIECKHAIEHREEIERWRNARPTLYTPTTCTPSSKNPGSTDGKGGCGQMILGYFILIAISSVVLFILYIIGSLLLK